MAYVDIPATGDNYIATVTVSRDGKTEHIQLINLVDQSANDAIGAGAAGVSNPGSGMLGWLSGIYNRLVAFIGGSNEQSVSTGGMNGTLTTLSTYTASSPLYLKTSAGRVCRIVNTDTNATPAAVTVYIINQASGAANTTNQIFSFNQMAAGQVIELQWPCSAGIGIYQSGGALTANLGISWS